MKFRAGDKRFENKTLAGERAESAIGSAAGRGGDRAAFENLAHVDGQARIVAEHDRQRGEVGRIVASARQHHVAAGLERLDERLAAHLRDEMAGGVDGFFGQLGHERQRADFPGAQGGFHRFLFDVGGDHAQAEGEIFLAGDFFEDFAAPGQMRRSARSARRADDDRHAEFQSFDEHVAQIALDERPIGERLAAAEIIRPGIGRAGVAGDQMRLPRDAFHEGFFGKTVAQDRGGREDAKFFVWHGHGQVLGHSNLKSLGRWSFVIRRFVHCFICRRP